VKSANRALQILELFDALRVGSNTATISEITGIPPSSTAVLLRALADTGYLTYDANTRLYTPTCRVSLLGNWVDPFFSREGPVIELINELANHLGVNVALMEPDHLHLRILRFRRPNPDKRPGIVVPTGGSIFKPGGGYALLSLFPDEEVRRLLRQYNAHRGSDPAIEAQSLLQEVETTRRNGVSVATNPVDQSWSIVMPLPLSPSGGKLALALGQFTPQITVDVSQTVNAMKRYIGKWLKIK
jgi:DNA-binding IclR family transcriptional regulator